MAAALDPFSLRQEKEALWALEDGLEALTQNHHNAFLEVTNLLHQAIELDPERIDARRSLVALYVNRLDELEARGNSSEHPLLEPLIQRYDDGTFSARLSARATVTLVTTPAAEVYHYRMVEEARVLRPTDEQCVGRTPVTVALEPGRALLVVRAEGYEEARYPLRMRRGQHIALLATLLPFGSIRPGFCLVPAGPAWLGGDPEAFVDEVIEVDVAALAIARHPVTCGEYLEFLNAMAAIDPEAAVRHAPRTPAGASRWPRTPNGRYRLPEIDTEGDPVSAFDPVMLVSAFDAEAWCTWRAGVDGLPLRLPTAVEWEKAARGADGRFFPWGDRFETSFCNNRQSRPGKARLLPVGTFPEDISPYGVMGMAGGVSEVTAGSSTGSRRVCGGAWFVYGRQCRLARRVEIAPDQVNPSVGFRVCYSL